MYFSSTKNSLKTHKTNKRNKNENSNQYPIIPYIQPFIAQTATKEQVISELPELVITEGVNLHIISPEPIQYVDLSTQNSRVIYRTSISRESRSRMLLPTSTQRKRQKPPLYWMATK